MEIVENVALMKEKKVFTEFGTTTAKALGLMMPYVRSGRICLGDSQFGLAKTCCALLERGF